MYVHKQFRRNKKDSNKTLFAICPKRCRKDQCKGSFTIATRLSNPKILYKGKYI